MLRKFSLLFLFVSVFFITATQSVYADFSLAGSNSFTGTVGVATPITDLQITGTGSEPIPVKLLVTNGTLQMSTTTGLTFDGGTSGSVLYFSGSLENINNALATLTYTRGSTGSDTLEVSLVPRGEVFFTDNNHLYKFISGSIDANGARTAAANQTAYGASGYLATITSVAENDFVADRLQGDGWMGASDASTEGDWKWITGPESGTSFWSGKSNGNTVGGNYANWSSGEPNDYNNGVPGEDCAQFYVSTGLWNDLPCSGHTLSGYVVEFGAPGDLPTVTAKNISLSTITAPTASSFSPTDNSTGISLDTNLVIEFSAVISQGTGNVTLYKTADDSVVETIAVTSDQVTGFGTDTITINPTSNLEESTSYYITIASTAFKNSSEAFYSGISNTTTWNFTTGDFTDPQISDITATSVGTSSATITWSTDEQASSQVDYGLVSNYGFQTTESDTAPRVTSHSVVLNDLKACARYFYRVRSKDASANVMVSSQKTFTTTGCSVSSIERGSEETVPTTGGTVTFTHNNSTNTLTIPNGFYGEGADFQINKLAMNTIPSSPNGKTLVDQNFFDLIAVSNSNDQITSFSQNVTFTTNYGNPTENSFYESTLDVYKYTGGSWVKQNCSVDVSANTITCSLPSFSIYAVFGEEKNNDSSSSMSAISSSGVCTELPLFSIPSLFQLDTSTHAVTLYFSPVLETADYYISYATNPSAEEHGTLVRLGSDGVQSFTVEQLAPATTYYFKVRGHKNCMPGEWSPIMSATTQSINWSHDEVVIRTEEKSEDTVTADKNTLSDKPEEPISDRIETHDVTFVVNDNGKPVAGLAVELHSNPRYGTTDDSGKVTFKDVEKGEHTFKIISQAYAAEEKVVIDVQEKEFDVAITLTATPTQSLTFYKMVAIVFGILSVILIVFLFLRKKK